jgi:cellulose synthase operon protein B
MKHKWFAFLIIPVVILSLFSGLILPASAQGVGATPTPTVAVPTAIPQGLQVPTDPNAVSFFQISQSEVQLNGPFDSSSLVFGLPPNWRLLADASLDLHMAVSFNTLARPQDTTIAPVMQGGTLTVRFNGYTVAVISLNQVGEITQKIPLTTASMASQRNDGRFEVGFILDSGISCYVSQQMTVFIHTTSQFILPHEQMIPEASLIKFPQPLFQGSVFPENALIVIPDNPSSAELQAALTVSAGMSNLTGNSLAQDLTTVGKLTSDQQIANNLILVGKAASLPLLSNVTMPLPVSGGKFAFVGDNTTDNGVVQMANSPWSLPRVVLVVSGNTDAGVVKAAQAVTTGLLRPNTAQNLSIIEQVEPNPVKVSTPIDQSLNDLALADTGSVASPGKALKTLRFASVNNASYRFYIPAGQTVTPDAFFDLVFGHSALLNYGRSGLVISINGQPVGSIRLSDATAVNSTNHAQITIPSTVILPGYNRLDIKANLVPNDACINPTLDGLWATIWGDSNLHLPLTPTQVDPLATVDLASYPAPFIYQPTLGSTAFVLPHDNLDAWRSAVLVAASLGDRANGPVYTFAAYYGDELKDPDRAKYNLIIIGQPSNLPLVNEMNANLPAPFAPSSDVAIESNMQVKFNIPANAPTGYVQLLASPWNPQNLIVAALGNSPQGVTWSSSALYDPVLRTRLAGNFAAINGTQVVTTDTRLISYQQGADIVSANPTPGLPSNVALIPVNTNRPVWLIPAIYVALGLMGLVLLIALVSSFVRGRRV